MTPPPAAPAARSLLVASLLLNLFAAGVIGGGVVTLDHPALWRARGVRAPVPLRAAGAALPQPDRARFRAAVRAALRDTADLAQAARENRREAAELFTAPAFDAAAVDAALARARAADLAIRGRLETDAVAFAATLPPDERALLAEQLARGGPLRHPRRFRRAADPAAPE